MATLDMRFQPSVYDLANLQQMQTGLSPLVQTASDQAALQKQLFVNELAMQKQAAEKEADYRRALAVQNAYSDRAEAANVASEKRQHERDKEAMRRQAAQHLRSKNFRAQKPGESDEDYENEGQKYLRETAQANYSTFKQQTDAFEREKRQLVSDATANFEARLEAKGRRELNLDPKTPKTQLKAKDAKALQALIDEGMAAGKDGSGFTFPERERILTLSDKITDSRKALNEYGDEARKYGVRHGDLIGLPAGGGGGGGPAQTPGGLALPQRPGGLGSGFNFYGDPNELGRGVRAPGGTPVTPAAAAAAAAPPGITGVPFANWERTALRSDPPVTTNASGDPVGPGAVWQNMGGMYRSWLPRTTEFVGPPVAPVGPPPPPRDFGVSPRLYPTLPGASELMGFPNTVPNPATFGGGGTGPAPSLPTTVPNPATFGGGGTGPVFDPFGSALSAINASRGWALPHIGGGGPPSPPPPDPLADIMAQINAYKGSLLPRIGGSGPAAPSTPEDFERNLGKQVWLDYLRRARNTVYDVVDDTSFPQPAQIQPGVLTPEEEAAARARGEAQQAWRPVSQYW